MDYRSEKKEAFKIICKRKQVTKPQGDTATADISAFWKECSSDGTIPALCGYMPSQPTLGGILGICFTNDMGESEFPYGIGVEYNGEPANNDDLDAS